MAVEKLHERLQELLPKPVELWGVKVGTRSSLVGAEEKAVLASFLRARDWDINDAYFMFKSSLEWRKIFGVDKLQHNQFGDMPRERFAGRDRHGRLLVVLRLGELQASNFNDLDKFVRWRVYMQEALNSQLNFASGEPSYTLVLNCEGFTRGHFSKAARQCATELSKVSQDNYPDFLHQILICNPPGIFAFAFGVLRPFLPKNFVSMIQVHQCDEVHCIELQQQRQLLGPADGSRTRGRIPPRRARAAVMAAGGSKLGGVKESSNE